MKTILAALFLIFGGATAFAETDTPEPTPSIGGYSPVSYFTAGVPQKGKQEFAVNHEGNTYYLTSAEQVTLFEENPGKYQPRYDSCPYSLAHGGKRPLDPTNFKIVGGFLLLFHLSDDVDGLALWEQSPLSDSELLDRADKQYVLLRF